MADLTTLAAVKEYLGQKTAATTDDALFSKLISRASAFIVTMSSREYLSQTYNETRDGHGSNRMILRNQNVTAVASVTINGQSVPSGGNSQTPGFWFNGRWVYLNGYSFPLGLANVQIVYTAGFATVPNDIEQVCIELVANKYRRKDRVGEESKNLNGMVISFSRADMSSEHREILKDYENKVPV